jgi:hypothetical protein
MPSQQRIFVAALILLAAIMFYMSFASLGGTRPQSTCGGGGCAAGEGCAGDGACASGACRSGVCVLPPPPSPATTPLGGACKIDAACVSGYCASGACASGSSALAFTIPTCERARPSYENVWAPTPKTAGVTCAFVYMLYGEPSRQWLEVLAVSIVSTQAFNKRCAVHVLLDDSSGGWDAAARSIEAMGDRIAVCRVPTMRGPARCGGPTGAATEHGTSNYWAPTYMQVSFAPRALSSECVTRAVLHV